MVVQDFFIEGHLVAVEGAPEVEQTAVEPTPEIDYYEPWHTQSIRLATKAALPRRLQVPKKRSRDARV